MVKKNESTEVAVTSGLGALPAMPDYIDTQSSDGKDKLNAGEDTIIPRLLLIHGTSKNPNNVPLGHFSTNLYNQDLGQKITFVILQAAPGWLMFAPQDEGGKLISRKFKDDLIPPMEEEIVLNPENQKWREVDQIDPRTQKVIGKKQIKPLAGRAYLYIGLLNGETPVALTLSSSGLKNARKLNSQLLGVKGPSYAVVYEVTVKEDTKGDNTWYIPDFEPARYATKEEIAAYSAMFQQFKMKKKDVSIDDDGDAGEKADGPTAADPNSKF